MVAAVVLQGPNPLDLQFSSRCLKGFFVMIAILVLFINPPSLTKALL